ncbi:hypothetical protein BGZ63DRAFT_388459 [Mariannaea sp. PMI_226]|nr:hypothetical protein BGZ63DRAFT_388459 [Mariannaea sp. PMI_226]
MKPSTSDANTTAVVAQVPSLEFVVGNTPAQLKVNATRRIKSHVSRQAWKTHFKNNPKPPPSRRRRKNAERAAAITTTYEYVGGPTARNAEEVDAAGVGAAVVDAPPPGAQLQLQLQLHPPERLTLDYHLGGGRVDPFKSYPRTWKPFIPALVDHYLVHMAVDIPELDQPGNKGLLRSSWFPLVMSDAATFQTILLLSASNSVSNNRVPDTGYEILQLKSDAITFINAAFSNEQRRISDAVIGAVAKMASFEAMHGSVESYQLHMRGLQRMVSIRGGLSALGLGGLLRRIVVWIDLNSSFLLKTPRFFPRESFAEEGEPEPSPQSFLAP